MKRFKKIIFSICFVIAFIFSINIKLFASNGYNIDNNGNIESLNLFNVNQTLNNQGITLNYTNSTYTINGTNTIRENIGLPTYITLNSGTYTISTQNVNGTSSSDFRLVLHDLNWTWQNTIYFNRESSTTFTIDITTNITFDVYGPNINNTINCTGNIMLNQGTEVLNYFPYGMYYNSSNTLNNNSYLSPFNIDYVESETFYINGLLDQGEEPVGYGGTYLFYDIEHTNAQGQNNWKSIVNFNRILPSMTILFKPSGNNFYHLYVYKNEELLYDTSVRYNENNEESDYYLTIPEFNRIELYCDIDNVSAPNQEIVLANTYEQGYTYGYSNGYNQGYAQGESSSYGNGYSTGYQKGIREANQNSLYNMILAIVDTPIHIFKGIFDFNVLGINLTNFVLSLISILIVVWLLKFFL